MPRGGFGGRGGLQGPGLPPRVAETRPDAPLGPQKGGVSPGTVVCQGRRNKLLLPCLPPILLGYQAMMIRERVKKHGVVQEALDKYFESLKATTKMDE